MLIGKVTETFLIRGRGVVVTTDTAYEQLPQDLKLKVGDPIEFRRGGALILRTKVAGIEHCDPWTPKRLFAFLLSGDVRKEEVPTGVEVWSLEHDRA